VAGHGDHDRRGLARRLPLGAQARGRLLVLPRLHDKAYALVVLQFFLAAMNARGIYKNE
jgi:hypothetical protein